MGTKIIKLHMLCKHLQNFMFSLLIVPSFPAWNFLAASRAHEMKNLIEEKKLIDLFGFDQ